jgi:protein-disulfide isomerase
MALQDRVTARAARVAECAASAVTIAVGVAVLTTAVSRYVWGGGDSRGGGPADRAATAGEEVSVGRHIKGDPNAKVVILEFSDFECQFCRKYARGQYSVVMRDLVETGKAAYAFRHLPLDVIHPRALVAGVAAECAGEQGRFWEMHDALFGGALSDAAIGKHAEDLGLDRHAFTACLARDSRQGIQADLDDARRLGVAGTPTFLVGVSRPAGRMKVTQVLHGAQGLSAITAAVDAAAAGP